MAQIIGPQSKSFEAILADLEDFVKVQPEAAKWRDFFQDGVGQTFLDLLAGEGAFLSLESNLVRRESYVQTAAMRSSKMLMAAMMGYVVNRKSAPVIVLELDFGAEPSTSYDKAEPIATWRGNPLVLMQNAVLGPGIEKVMCYLGTWKTAAQVGNDAFGFFTIVDLDIDNNVDRLSLTVDGDAVPLVRYAEELDSTNALIVSLDGGAAIQFGDGFFGMDPNGNDATLEYVAAYGLFPFLDGDVYSIVLGSATIDIAGNLILVENELETGNAVRLSPGALTTLPVPLESGQVYYVIVSSTSAIKLALTKTEALANSPIDLVEVGAGSMTLTVLTDIDSADIVVNTDPVATLVSAVVLDRGSEADSNDKITMLLPGYFAARRAMVSATDHEDILLGYSGSLISASARKKVGVCCTVQMSYLFDNEHVATDTEVDQMLGYLLPFKMAGETIEIVHPRRIGLTLTMTVVATPAAIADDLATKIQELVLSKIRVLGKTFHVGQITSGVGDIDGVYAVYLQSPSSDKTLDVEEYIGLDALNVSLTTDRNVVKTVDPDNSGYTESIDTEIDPVDVPPGAPQSLSSIDSDSNSVTLSWIRGSTNETGFRIELRLSTESDLFFQQVGEVGAGILTFEVDGLLPETFYVFRVRAFNGAGVSGYSQSVSVKTDVAPIAPIAPTELIATVQVGQIMLTWLDNSTNEVSFVVERKLSVGLESEYAQVHVTGPNVQTWTDTTVDPLTEYDYRVKARNAEIDSEYAEVLNVMTTSGPVPAPADIFVGAVTQTSVQVVWLPPPVDITGYDLERKLSAEADDAWVVVGNPTNDVATFTDTTVGSSTEYNYRIKAKNGVVESDYSPVLVVITPEAAPAEPDDLELDWTPGFNTKLNATWMLTGEPHVLEYRKVNTPTFEWIALADTAAGHSSQEITGLTANTDYEVRLKAKGATLDGPYALSGTKHTPTTVLAPGPTSLAAAPGPELNQADLTWSLAGVGTHVAIIVEYTAAAYLGRWYRSAVLGIGVTSVTAVDLPYNTALTFRVFAEDSQSYSAADTEPYTTPPEP